MIAVILFPLIILGGSWFAGSSLTSPVNQPVGNCPQDLVCENVAFPSDSGTTIKGWLVRGEQGKGAVILMHGLRSNRLSLMDRIRFFKKSGFSVLAFDFQGSGESEGKTLTFGYLESRDATAAMKFTRDKFPGEKIGVMGISMGGAAFLLQKDAQKTDALILEMVYPTMQRAIENRMNLWFFKGADNLSPLMTQQFPLRLGVSVDELRPIDKVSEINAPLLLIAGEKDVHTTLEESNELFAKASEPKEMWVVPGAEHGDLLQISPPEYENRVTTFFAKTLKK